jgi:hypothetical protein
MEWALGSLIGFALATALVVVLARSSTARWERGREPDGTGATAAAPASPPRRARAAARRVAARFPHLPAGVVARLPHPHVPVPHLHLPHPRLRVPHPRLLHLSRRRPHRERGRVSGPGSGTD